MALIMFAELLTVKPEADQLSPVCFTSRKRAGSFNHGGGGDWRVEEEGRR